MYIKERIKNFFNLVYLKLIKINDTPQRVSLGLAFGVALGIIPGTGPIAALTLAFILRLNRMAALLGSLMVNTWLSFLTLALAIKLGARIFSLNCQELYNKWFSLIRNFQWLDLFKMSVLKIILPILTGYAMIAIVAGILTYIVAILILSRIRYGDKSRINFSG